MTAIALIAAVGAQNAFLLRHALRGAIPVWPLVVVCIVSEMGLITLGVTGAGVVMASAPWAMTLITWFGVVFLVSYGIFALRRAWVGGSALEASADPEKAVSLERERETVAVGAAVAPSSGTNGAHGSDGPVLGGGDLAEPAGSARSTSPPPSDGASDPYDPFVPLDGAVAAPTATVSRSRSNDTTFSVSAGASRADPPTQARRRAKIP